MKRLFFLLSMLLSVASIRAVQAYPGVIDFVQPNGDTLQIRLVGDERFHYATTADGYLVQKNDKGYYCYAVWEEYTDQRGKAKKRAVVAKYIGKKTRVANNPDQRRRSEERWLKRKLIPHLTK